MPVAVVHGHLDTYPVYSTYFHAAKTVLTLEREGARFTTGIRRI